VDIICIGPNAATVRFDELELFLLAEIVGAHSADNITIHAVTVLGGAFQALALAAQVCDALPPLHLAWDAYREETRAQRRKLAAKEGGA